MWILCSLLYPQSVCSGVKKEQIRGLGFDATCSLVVLDKECRPLSVSHTGEISTSYEIDVSPPRV